MSTHSKTNFLFSILALGGLLLSACGSANPETDVIIATSVAQTVEAQMTELARPTATLVATQTPIPSPAATTATATFAPSPTPVPGNVTPCLRAQYVSETIPDGTIMTPGQVFYKTWRIENTGSCTWDSSYKIVFWSGELMGGAYVYDLYQIAVPDQMIDITLQLKAPDSPGSYRGYWKLQSPWGGTFGVGDNVDTPLWVDIVVSDETNPDFAVTSVVYNVVRDPQYGCPTNTNYTVYATISTNGPVDVTYRWLQSDGNDSGSKTLEFDQAESQTISRSWLIHKGASTNPRWMQIVILEPNDQEFGKAYILYDCQ